MLKLNKRSFKNKQRKEMLMLKFFLTVFALFLNMLPLNLVMNILIWPEDYSSDWFQHLLTKRNSKYIIRLLAMAFIGSIILFTYYGLRFLLCYFLLWFFAFVRHMLFSKKIARRQSYSGKK